MRFLVFIGIFVGFIFTSCSSGLFSSKSVALNEDCNGECSSSHREGDSQECVYDIDIEKIHNKRKRTKSKNNLSLESEPMVDPYPVQFIGARYVGGAVGFSENERKHVKFSYYDPFPEGSDYFTVDIDSTNSVYPMQGKFLSGFGRRGRSNHSGVDIKGETGRNIYAVFSGVVRMSEYYSGYGNVIVIRHDNGLETVYSHNRRNKVRSGDRVEAGDIIAECGRTGRATTEHLHFELRIKGVTYNPTNILDLHNQQLRTGRLQVLKRSNGTLGFELYQPGDTIRSHVNNIPNMGSNAISAEEPNKNELINNQTLGNQPATNNETARTEDVKSSQVKQARVHTIVKGDTLSALARKYRVSVAQICRLNNIKATTILSLGRKLKID